MVSAIASAAPATCRRRGSDFAELPRAVQQAGLLRRRHGYYAVKGALTVAVFVAVWFVFGYVGDSWWQLFTASFLFFPLLLVEVLNLHWSSIQIVWRGEAKWRGLEKSLLIAHIGAYLTAVFLVLSPLTAIVFIAVHKGLWGVYMGCSFAPNHKGMPTLTEGHTLDFLRKQVLTSRNVRGRRWVDFALGGLNYQIEHHLFPSMPRPNLRRAQPIVQGFCVAHDINYSQCGLLRSYGHVPHHLHAVGAPLCAAPPSAILSGAPSSHPRSLPVPQQLRSILITGDRKEQ